MPSAWAPIVTVSATAHRFAFSIVSVKSVTGCTAHWVYYIHNTERQRPGINTPSALESQSHQSVLVESTFNQEIGCQFPVLSTRKERLKHSIPRIAHRFQLIMKQDIGRASLALDWKRKLEKLTLSTEACSAGVNPRFWAAGGETARRGSEGAGRRAIAPLPPDGGASSLPSFSKKLSMPSGSDGVRCAALSGSVCLRLSMRGPVREGFSATIRRIARTWAGSISMAEPSPSPEPPELPMPPIPPIPPMLPSPPRAPMPPIDIALESRRSTGCCCPCGCCSSIGWGWTQGETTAFAKDIEIRGAHLKHVLREARHGTGSAAGHEAGQVREEIRRLSAVGNRTIPW